MSALVIERAIHAPDYSSEKLWNLCDWCRQRGAEAFSLELLGTVPVGDRAYVELEDPIRAFAIATAVRERLTAMPGQPFVRSTELWSLTAASLGVLPRLFPNGPFAYAFGTPAWCEDLTLYRGGALLLGIISHEDWGLLRLTDVEATQLAAAGYPTHDPSVPFR